MRTSPPRSASHRLLLAALLSLPLSAVVLAGPAAATSGGPSSPKANASSSAAADRDDRGRESAPGQQRKEATSAPAAASDPAPATAESGATRNEPASKPAEQKPAEPKRSEQAPAKSEPAAKKAQPASQPTSASKPAPGSAGASGDTSKPQPLSNADRNGTGANPGDSCDHAYCSTRDGSPSLNGNGSGDAKGKPCAGCVGKADNKNPKGQAPNGSDRNNGYECDGNKGIGKGNPAHTGCKPATQEPPVQTCPAGTPPGGTMANGCKGTSCPAGTPAGGTMANGCKAETCPAGTPVGGTMANGCKAETCPAGTPVGGTMANGCTVDDDTDTPGGTSTPPTEVLSGTVVRPGVNPLVVPLAAQSPQLLNGPAAQALAPADAVQARPTVLPFTGIELVWLLPAALVALGLGLAFVAFGRPRSAVRV